MAQKVTVELEDDMDGGPADETMRFGLDSTEYEIDLSEKNARTFRMQLAPFVEHARKAGRGSARRATRTAAARLHSGEVRAWAKDHGIAVSARGRIPASVIEQYQAKGNLASPSRRRRPATARLSSHTA
jgi:nucleoid-associated protein Lsr2